MGAEFSKPAAAERCRGHVLSFHGVNKPIRAETETTQPQLISIRLHDINHFSGTLDCS